MPAEGAVLVAARIAESLRSLSPVDADDEPTWTHRAVSNGSIVSDRVADPEPVVCVDCGAPADDRIHGVGPGFGLSHAFVAPGQPSSLVVA